MKKLICIILFIISISVLLINNNIKNTEIKNSNSDLKYLLSVKDSSKDKQYKTLITYDSSNNIKINSNKKIDRPLLALNKNIQNDSEVNSTNNDNGTNNLNNDDVQLLAHLIESEAGDEPVEGKIAVGNVVVNRMNVDKKDMTDIVYAKSQFDGVETSNFSKQPGADSLEAASKVLTGFNLVPDAYFFADLKLCNPDFALKNKFIIRIGDHWFFRK
ncbi:MAG: cell wall hydrolase [Clostridium tyrobutyricum]|jgi:spore germination cell wall hydrolase CwlJ-like protein|uniref:cell wall hydrolase n=1 Tax=Clostridium tyrobutyricum TaxID=1519 RepID=UPI00243314BA|nr:cell wall hydrolase [Clostridium tyrobutyricum]MCH4200570.1 cell wall hydrolase [Clostridium tyrobutyricum]MCH4237583.1 cell wall hydrolase [Clostridium tyrobutyricum]MCH4259706.1 cell wall hydrolase [Clostridium tyrobutyricum]